MFCFWVHHRVLYWGCSVFLYKLMICTWWVFNPAVFPLCTSVCECLSVLWKSWFQFPLRLLEPWIKEDTRCVCFGYWTGEKRGWNETERPLKCDTGLRWCSVTLGWARTAERESSWKESCLLNFVVEKHSCDVILKASTFFVGTHRLR